jgi:hypothetical protein
MEFRAEGTLGVSSRRARPALSHTVRRIPSLHPCCVPLRRAWRLFRRVSPAFTSCVAFSAVQTLLAQHATSSEPFRRYRRRRVCRVCRVCRVSSSSSRGVSAQSVGASPIPSSRGVLAQSVGASPIPSSRGVLAQSVGTSPLPSAASRDTLRNSRSDAVDDDLTLREYRRVQGMGALGLSLVFLCGLRSLVHIYVLPIDQPSCHAWHSRSARVPTLKRSWEHTVYGTPYYSCATRLLLECD